MNMHHHEDEEIKELGQLTVDSVKHHIPQSKGKLFTKLTLTRISLINIKMSGDSNCPLITGCCLMTDSEVVLCDCSNLCLKFLSDSFIIKESLQLD